METSIIFSPLCKNLLGLTRHLGVFISVPSGLGCLESLPGPVVSIETEMAMEQFKERHSQEVQDLKIELETKVDEAF